MSAESRAFPGWPAARIHASLNETHMSPRTLADLTRVGRRLGRQEGTTPDDDPQIGRHRRQAHGTGLRAGRAEGIAAQRVLLGRLASRKFDPATAERLAEALAEVHDHGRLAEIGDRIIDCDDGAALLADVLMLRTPGEPPEAVQADYRRRQRSGAGYRSRSTASHRRGRRRSPFRSAGFLIGMLLPDSVLVMVSANADFDRSPGPPRRRPLCPAGGSIMEPRRRTMLCAVEL